MAYEKSRLMMVRPWSVHKRVASDSSSGSSTTGVVVMASPSDSRPRFPSYTSSDGSAGGAVATATANRPRFPSYTSDASSPGGAGNRPRFNSSGDHSFCSSVNGGGRPERVSAEEERLLRARKQVDGYLKKINPGLFVNNNNNGKPFSLNRESGMCYFPYQKFIVVMEVPADHPTLMYMYTCVSRLDHNDDDDNEHQAVRNTNVDAVDARVMRAAMELNYMQHRTRGATLGVEGNEVNLCMSTPVSSLSTSALQARMEDFCSSALEVHTILERAKKLTV